MTYLLPQWPISDKVFACTTVRSGGVSKGAYSSFNLGSHVGDDAEAVAENRKRLVRDLNLPEPPRWLDQCHGIKVVNYAELGDSPQAADACYSRKPGQVCAVLTADCLPVLLAQDNGRAVAAVHAGWRGLVNGIIEAAVDAMAIPGENLLAWLGPAIGPRQFEVGAEVREQFVTTHAAAESCFVQNDGPRYLADIYALARIRLFTKGVQQVYGGDFCTVEDASRFFSYRRDHQTGRMASLIYMRPE